MINSRLRPILFSGPMVRAILDGRKTQTRRIVKLPSDAEQVKYWTTPSRKPQEGYADPGVNYWTRRGNHIDPCPYGVPGDRLWVRESLTHITSDPVTARPCDVHCYTASVPRGMSSANPYEPNYLFPHDGDPPLKPKNMPGIFMPRWASRITLEVLRVRVERLQEISYADAEAEGIDPLKTELYPHTNRGYKCQRAYRVLWDSINAKRGYGWDKNPWVWVVEFRRIG